MVKRVCPVCGAEWWSADSAETWICEKCGAEMGEMGLELNEAREEKR